MSLANEKNMLFYIQTKNRPHVECCLRVCRIGFGQVRPAPLKYHIFHHVSTRRRKNETEKSRNYDPCRFYGSKNNHVEQVYPILEWSDDDVRDFIIDRGITLAPLYYTDGELHIERRLGCIGCPLASKGIADILRHSPELQFCCEMGIP